MERKPPLSGNIMYCCLQFNFRNYGLIPLSEWRNAFSRAEMLKRYGRLDIFSFQKKKSSKIISNKVKVILIFELRQT
jgi:hypothetical protein